MPKPLYLVRRGLETYLGPMTSSELIQAYRRMDFGLQDEVAGHQGPWIAFDDLPNIKKHYPNLAETVKRSMLAGWGMSAHNSNADQSRVGQQPKRKSSGMSLALSSLVVILTLGVLLFVRSPKVANQFLDSLTGINPSLAAKLLNHQDEKSFQEFMTKNSDEIVSQINQSKVAYQEWIPFVRAHAFLGSGSIPGLSPKLLKGINAQHAPNDCSIESWHKRWLERNGSWENFLQGRQLPQMNWARVLTWDPHWIARRSKEPGWVVPKNYYEGCIKMAEKALNRLVEFPEKGMVFRVPREFTQRLSHSIAVISGSKMVPPLTGDDPLTALSCIERALDNEQIDQCYQDDVLTGDWNEYLKHRKGLARMAIILVKPVGETEMSELRILGGQYSQIDPHTKFDYGAEWKFISAIERSSGRTQEARERIQKEFPTVDLGFE